jgi:hypothetical protein
MILVVLCSPARRRKIIPLTKLSQGVTLIKPSGDGLAAYDLAISPASSISTNHFFFPHVHITS